ncbi:MAG: peptide deformylase [Bdellovibrionales bacterium]|nr:peptide deformylase [Bdellovibrionales bacterium]
MLEILKYPDPRLAEKSQRVEIFDADLHRFLDDMATSMYAANGIGLAAPQVNRLWRLFIIDIRNQDDRYNRILEFINPVLSNGRGSIDFEEACLSVPGISEFVKRKAEIRVEYQDRFGNPQLMDADGLLAVAVQHENDHLDGHLFIERVSPLKRRLLKRKLEKTLLL